MKILILIGHVIVRSSNSFSHLFNIICILEVFKFYGNIKIT